MTSDPPQAEPYLALLGIQTLAASLLFWMIFPVFEQVALHSGEAQALGTDLILMVAATVAVQQGCYWMRYRRVTIWVPLHSPLLGHLLLFASRASFFFGGALFSAVFFRHIPQLDVLPPIGRGLATAAGVLVVLFALFTYALELERLGRAIEAAPAP